MKILFVTDLYPIGKEQIAKALFYFVQEWKNQGHIVEAIRPNFIFNTLLRGRKIIEEKIYYEKEIKIYNLNFFTPFLFNVYEKLPDDFSLKDYDVLISHMPCGALMANQLLKKDKIEYITSVHCSDIAVLTKPYYSIYFKNELKKSYLNADKISARSLVLESKIQQLIPNIKDKVFVASSGIDDKIINNNIQLRPFNKEYTTITTVSSLIKRKNIDITLKALSKLKNKNFIFKIIGNGPEINKLKKLVEKLNLENNVIFLGYLDRTLVFKELIQSDLFILVSNNETFGLCYLEAMAMGNIVIGKQFDGIDGIIKNGYNGFLVNKNVDELKNCIQKILDMNNEDLNQIKNNSIETVKSHKQSVAAEKYLNNINSSCLFYNELSC